MRQQLNYPRLQSLRRRPLTETHAIVGHREIDRYFMENERAKLLAQAERCRRLVASITDPDTVERLTGLAEECERRAAEITSKGKEGDR